MTTNKFTMHPMPMLIIDTCSSEDNIELIKKQISSKSDFFPRSLSLLNYGDAYTDLSGTRHYSSLNRLRNFLIRSTSCPNNSSWKYSISTTTVNFLDPCNNTHSPAGSSSRYSLYGSFFDLSENDYPSSLMKSENKLLSKLSINTVQDKCQNWLSHLDVK
jgi:hypothetical protein